MQLKQGNFYVSLQICSLFDDCSMWTMPFTMAKMCLFNPFLRLIQDILDINPIFGFALHPTLVPPKKSSTHFYVNNRDPLCTKKVPLPSQQETAARPSQPALRLTPPGVACIFMQVSLQFFFHDQGKIIIITYELFYTKKEATTQACCCCQQQYYSPSFYDYTISR